jgi:hypothetical protein
VRPPPGTPRAPRVPLSLLAVFVASCAHVPPAASGPQSASRPRLVESRDAILLKGDDVLVIENTRFIHHAAIELRDRSRLVIRNAVFEHRNEYSFQHTLEATDDAQVEILDSEIVSSPWLNWNFRGRARLTQRDVQGRESRIWHYFPDDSRADFTRARFAGTVDGRAQVRIASAPATQIEVVLPEHSKLETSFPRHMAQYVFPGSGSPAGFRLEVTDSQAEFWGVTLQPASDLTIRDTDGIVITVSATPSWDHETVELGGLARELYADRTWDLPRGARLRLVNTRVAGWSPIAFADNTLIVRDSVLNDQAFSGGRALVVFERVSTSFVRAREDVRIVLRNSVVEGDVVAQDNGRIELIGTRVGGRLVREGNGVIVQDPEPP